MKRNNKKELTELQWNLTSSSNQFTTYLSAYSLFLSSIAGVMLCDYYIIRKGYLVLEHLYSAAKDAPYYYSFGVSWRAYAAYIAGILINIVGFVGAVHDVDGGAPVPVGARYIYNVNFFAGIIVSAGVYYILCLVFPIPATSDKWNEVGVLDDHFAVSDGQEPGTDEENVGIEVDIDDGKGVSVRSSAKNFGDGRYL